MATAWAVVAVACCGRASHAQQTIARVSPAPPAHSDVDRLRRLAHVHLENSEQELHRLKTRIPPLAKALKELLEQVAKVPARDQRGQPPAEAEAPTEVLYRPPMQRRTPKEQIVFACLEGKVSYINRESLPERLEGILKRRQPEMEAREEVKFELRDGDLVFRLCMEGRRRDEEFQWELFAVSKPGSTRGSWANVQRSDSWFRRELAARSPASHHCLFVVWPDSYSLFHQVRALAWEAGFEVGWIPLYSGQALPLGAGTGGVVQ